MRPALLKALVGGRLLVGGAALVAPRATGRLFGIQSENNPALPYVARLFGVRAVAMGLLVATSSGAEQRRQLRTGLQVDAVDALAALVSGHSGQLPRRAALLGATAALFELALGSVAVHRTADRDAGGRADDQDRSRI